MNFFWNRIVKVCVSYKFLHDKKNTFFSDFWFKVVPRDDKEVWIVQESTSHIYDQNKRIEMAEITPVAHKDSAKFTIEIFSKVGFVDLSSIEFQPIQFETPSKDLHDSKCYIEDQVRYWSNSNLVEEMGMAESSPGSLSFSYECFEPNLKMVSQHFHGVDIRVRKCLFKASKIGTILTKNAFNFF